MGGKKKKRRSKKTSVAEQLEKSLPEDASNNQMMPTVKNSETDRTDEGIERKRDESDEADGTVLFCVTCNLHMTKSSQSHHRKGSCHIVKINDYVNSEWKRQIDSCNTAIVENQEKHITMIENQGILRNMATMLKFVTEQLNFLITKADHNVCHAQKALDEMAELCNALKASCPESLMELNSSNSKLENAIGRASSLFSTSYIGYIPLKEMLAWFVDCQKRCQERVFFQSGNSFSLIECQHNLLIMHLFREYPNPPNDAHIFKYEEMKDIFISLPTVTFIDISINSKSSRLVINVDQSFWGRQFAALCSGEKGPNLRSSLFHRVVLKGRPGCHFYGGDYNNGDGSGGETILVNEPVEPIQIGPIKQGTVASRLGFEDTSTIFRVYVHECEGSTVNPFGRITEGIDVIMYIESLDDITSPVICDSGLCVSL